MARIKQRLDIDKAFVLTRHLKLAGLNEERGRKIKQAIARMKGVAGVSVREDTETLRVSYDASKCSLEEIEKILLAHRCGIADDRWTRLKRNWYRFTDENARGNAEHVPHCCNKPPW